MQTFKCSCFGQPHTKSNWSLLESNPAQFQIQMHRREGSNVWGTATQLGTVSLLTSSTVSSTDPERKGLQRLILKIGNWCFINVMFHSSTRFLSTSALPCQPRAGALGAQSKQKLQLCMRNIVCIRTSCEEMQIQTGSLQEKLKNIDF